MELVANRQFDTVYHEHFSYLSLHLVREIFAANGLMVWDVERLSTHGGFAPRVGRPRRSTRHNTGRRSPAGGRRVPWHA